MDETQRNTITISSKLIAHPFVRLIQLFLKQIKGTQREYKSHWLLNWQWQVVETNLSTRCAATISQVGFATMVSLFYWIIRCAAFFCVLYVIAVNAASKCETLKASLHYTQEDAPTDLSGVVRSNIALYILVCN